MTYSKTGANEFDPRAVIYEAYQIDGVDMETCRTIFFDWVLADSGSVANEALPALYEMYKKTYPHHPMTAVLGESLAASSAPKQRRGGWRRNRPKN